MPDSFPKEFGPRPRWLTFDCYGTLVQWDEAVAAAVGRILAARDAADEAPDVIAAYRSHETAIEAERPHRNFREVTREALLRAMVDVNLQGSGADADALVAAISAIALFPEVPDALARLKAASFGTCIISNTDDDIIAGTIAEIGPGLIDRVVTAEQAGAYKPSRRIFEHAWAQLGVAKDDVAHICASPRSAHAAARDLGFRCIWIDRGAGEPMLPDYVPDLAVPTLDRVPVFFASLGWM